MTVKEPVEVFQSYAIGTDDQCWPWLGPWGGRAGLQSRPYFQSHKRRQSAYRWVYELVHGVELTPDQLILHSCDNGNYPIGCGNPAHMRIGTNADNNDDAVARQRIGLPHTVVRAIRTLIEQGRSQLDIAALYGVSRETVSAIATQRGYKHVD